MLSTPEGLGNAAAQLVIQARVNDNANQAGGYTAVTSTTYPSPYQATNRADPASGRVPGGASFDANRWQPLRVPTGVLVDASGFPLVDNARPETYRDQPYLGVTWGAVRPFALGDPRSVLPPPPPELNNLGVYVDYAGRTTTAHQAYLDQFDEVREVTASLTDRQKVIAEYWADGPNSETPPGHWNQLANGFSWRDQHTVEEDVKLYFALNAALLDASIGTWFAKRNYETIRPISAIRDRYFDDTIADVGRAQPRHRQRARLRVAAVPVAHLRDAAVPRLHLGPQRLLGGRRQRARGLHRQHALLRRHHHPAVGRQPRRRARSPRRARAGGGRRALRADAGVLGGAQLADAG
jgi:hypothetical protein